MTFFHRNQKTQSQEVRNETGNLIPHPVLPPREVQIEKAALIYRAMKGTQRPKKP
jgi:hypothetical protein